MWDQEIIKNKGGEAKSGRGAKGGGGGKGGSKGKGAEGGGDGSSGKLFERGTAVKAHNHLLDDVYELFCTTGLTLDVSPLPSFFLLLIVLFFFFGGGSKVKCLTQKGQWEVNLWQNITSTHWLCTSCIWFPWRLHCIFGQERVEVWILKCKKAASPCISTPLSSLSERNLNLEIWLLLTLAAYVMMADSLQVRMLGRLMVSACSLVAVESKSCCTDPTALWTDEDLGWGWLEGCLLFLPPVSFLCGFMLLCFRLTTGFSHWWSPTVLVWGLLLPWLIVDSCLCKLSLQLIFMMLSWSTTMTLSFLEFAQQEFCRHVHGFHLCDTTSPVQLHLKLDGLRAGQAGSLENFFIWHVVLPFDAKDGVQAAFMKPLR